MRVACTALGAALVPFTFLTVWELTKVGFNFLVIKWEIIFSLYTYDHDFTTPIYTIKLPFLLQGSLNAAAIAGTLILFDVGLLTLNRYILLDPILLFFISGATYTMTKFRNLPPEVAFTRRWWSWLAATGACLAGAISVKFVGLFVVLLVGLMTIEQVCS